MINQNDDFENPKTDVQCKFGEAIRVNFRAWAMI